MQKGQDTGLFLLFKRSYVLRGSRHPVCGVNKTSNMYTKANYAERSGKKKLAGSHGCLCSSKSLRITAWNGKSFPFVDQFTEGYVGLSCAVSVQDSKTFSL